MAFKLVLFVAVCLAQCFALPKGVLLQKQLPVEKATCSNPSVSFSNEIEQTIQEMDALRDEVSMAAMEAYATGKEVRVAVACFAQQSPRYVKTGAILAKKMTKATVEIAGNLGEKAVRYAIRMEEPVRALAITFTTVPLKMYTYIQNKQFLQAARLMFEARRVVRENSILLAEAFSDMIAEVPEVADRVEFLATDIYTTARDSTRELREAFAKCVEEGGPKRPENAPQAMPEK